MLDAKVSSTKEIPEGMVLLQVPEQKRIIFTSESGPVNNIEFDLWLKIWVLEDQNKLDRNYVADYELYDERCQDPQNAQIAIHIGIS